MFAQHLPRSARAFALKTKKAVSGSMYPGSSRAIDSLCSHMISSKKGCDSLNLSGCGLVSSRGSNLVFGIEGQSYAGLSLG
jgi:hypothetical protein